MDVLNGLFLGQGHQFGKLESRLDSLVRDYVLKSVTDRLSSLGRLTHFTKEHFLFKLLVQLQLE